MTIGLILKKCCFIKSLPPDKKVICTYNIYRQLSLPATANPGYIESNWDSKILSWKLCFYSYMFLHDKCTKCILFLRESSFRPANSKWRINYSPNVKKKKLFLFSASSSLFLILSEKCSLNRPSIMF